MERRITPRQREVVQLVAAGQTNDEIAATLGISSRTVKAYTDELRRRLGVARRRQIPSAYLRLTGEAPLA
jgi:DNA-binding NarL/FixJ family response regulator